MSLSEKDVAELARAARLALTAEELTRYTQDLRSLEELAACLLLPSADTHPEEEPARLADLRNDSLAPCLARDELLQSAPVTKGGYVVVPRTVEGV